MIGRAGAGAHDFCCALLSIFCRIVGDLLSFFSFVPICACIIHHFLQLFWLMRPLLGGEMHTPDMKQ